MPKLVGHNPHVANRPAEETTEKLVKLSYSQKALLPQEQVFYRYNTSDRGGPKVLAKRWYEWFATPATIASCEKSTSNMLEKAA